jgi:hypothetical protein
MTNRQHLTVGVGMMCFSLMGLMPPWVHIRTDAPDTRISAGYAFITVGAQIEPDEENRPRDGDTRNGRFGRPRRTYRGAPLWLWSVAINTRRLLLQWLAVSLTTAGLVWFLGVRGRSSPPATSA